MTTHSGARVDVRRALISSGLHAREVLEDLVELAIRRGITDTSTDADIAAAVSRVRVDVPGPFEPPAPAEQGAHGAEEFRRRFPDTQVQEQPADAALASRRARDAEQVRAALLAASTAGRGA